MQIINKIATKISCKNRKRKYKLFIDILKPTKSDLVLDVGYCDVESKESENYLEKNYPYPENITALGIDEPTDFLKKYPKVKVIKYDGKLFPFDEKEFDIGWSNAVIEHVGDLNSQILFLKELRRTCKKVFFTTPNKYFPIETHTNIPLLHLISQDLFEKVAIGLKKPWATTEFTNLLSYNHLISILKAAGVKKYRIIKNKVLLFTLDFAVVMFDD